MILCCVVVAYTACLAWLALIGWLIGEFCSNYAERDVVKDEWDRWGMLCEEEDFGLSEKSAMVATSKAMESCGAKATARGAAKKCSTGSRFGSAGK